jgi:hypothetical protein
MNANRFPALTQFLGTYFHQDFLEDYATADDAITAFITGEPKSYVLAVMHEMERLVLLVKADNAADKRLLELGCYYNAQADGLLAEQWLDRVVGRLHTFLDNSGSVSGPDRLDRDTSCD